MKNLLLVGFSLIAGFGVAIGVVALEAWQINRDDPPIYQVDPMMQCVQDTRLWYVSAGRVIYDERRCRRDPITGRYLSPSP